MFIFACVFVALTYSSHMFIRLLLRLRLRLHLHLHLRLRLLWQWIPMKWMHASLVFESVPFLFVFLIPIIIKLLSIAYRMCVTSVVVSCCLDQCFVFDRSVVFFVLLWTWLLSKEEDWLARKRQRGSNDHARTATEQQSTDKHKRSSSWTARKRLPLVFTWWKSVFISGEWRVTTAYQVISWRN